MAKIAVFIPDLQGGGAERVVVNLVNYFASLGIDTDLVLAHAEGPLLQDIEPSVNIVDLHVPHRVAIIPALARYLKTAKPKTLLAHMDIANIAALLARRFSGHTCRLIICSHVGFLAQINGAKRLKDRLIRLAMRYCYSWADGIVAVSGGIKNELIKLTSLPECNITVIHNPIVTPDLASKITKARSHPAFLDKSSPVLIAMGRLVTAKDYPTLLKAFRIARDNRPLRLMILGNGKERAALIKLASRLNIRQDIDFLGFVRNPYPYLSQSDVFVLSSIYEGFGNVLVEAMACGVPVVATDCRSGPAEILSHGEYGTLVPVGDYKALAEAILATLSNPTPTQKLVKRSKEFSVERAASQYLQLLAVTEY